MPPPLGMRQEIIEIGMVAMDLNNLKILDEASYFVRPRRWEISLKCTQLTGITHEDVLGARSLSEVLNDLAKRFQLKQKASYAWGEDIPILTRACNSVGLANPFGHSIDLSAIFQGVFATKQRIGLKEATEMLGINFQGFAHGALPDAKNTAFIHAAILRRLRQQPGPIDVPPVKGGDTVLSPSLFAQKLSDSLNK